MQVLNVIQNMPEYALTEFRISQVLNMSEFWIWQGSEYARLHQVSKYHNMAEYVWIGCEYAWICLNLQ